MINARNMERKRREMSNELKGGVSMGRVKRLFGVGEGNFPYGLTEDGE